MTCGKIIARIRARQRDAALRAEFFANREARRQFEADYIAMRNEAAVRGVIKQPHWLLRGLPLKVFG